MKKLTLFSIAFTALSLASCTKDYTCTCTTTTPGSPISYTDITLLKKVSQETAEAQCANYDTKDPNGSTTSSRTCTLK